MRLLAGANHFNDVLFAVAFVIAAAHLCVIERNPAPLLLFLLPPGAALAVRRSRSNLPSSRALASLFLLLIGSGDIFAALGFHVPMQITRPGLSTHHAGLLSWYVIVYLFFAFILFPPFLFIRPLIQRRRGQKPYFSPFTCYLGLLAWSVTAPMMLGIVVNVLLRPR